MSKRKSSGLQPIRREKLPRRNEQCPCGSGKKAKHCCLSKISALAMLTPEARQQLMVDHILQKPIVPIPEPEIVVPTVDIAECTLEVQSEAAAQETTQ